MNNSGFSSTACCTMGIALLLSFLLWGVNIFLMSSKIQRLFRSSLSNYREQHTVFILSVVIGTATWLLALVGWPGIRVPWCLGSVVLSGVILSLWLLGAIVLATVSTGVGGIVQASGFLSTGRIVQASFQVGAGEIIPAAFLAGDSGIILALILRRCWQDCISIHHGGR